MRLLLDMGISVGLAGVLRSHGHDVAHLQERGLDTLADSEILKLAIAEKRIIVTHDLDFTDLLAASAAILPSVVIFRLRNMRPERVLARLLAVITDFAADLQTGAVISVTESQIRKRALPLELL
jgi:predicted nuclease of predicted toxin-antitoxin system